MHPSMAYLDSADEAALAFAQVSTMVEHLRDRAGADAVSRALDRVRDGADALDAVTAVAGDPTPDQFMQSWRASLAKMSLIRRKLEAAPTVLGAASDEYGVDPVLSKRRDLTGHARLGDLLRLAQKHDAALIEYGRAMPEDEPPSPLIVARAAESLVALGRVDEAVMRLEASIADYPEVPATRKALAVLFLARGRARDALNHFRAAADINPFDPSVQTALADLHARFGARELAARHARYARVLALGGEDPTSGASR
jgi:tetratricopeptide (TPR) repeat protein